MYDYALQNQRQLTAALRRAKALDDASGLQLRLGVLSQINFRQAPEVIRAIRAANPSARITMEFDGEEPLMAELWEGSYDLIVTNRDAISHWPAITYRELWRGSYHLSISAEVAAPTEMQDLEWLEDRSLITVAGDTAVSVRVLLDKLRMKYQFVPRARLEAPNQEALYRMVESGMGYAFVEAVPRNVPQQPRLHFLDTGIPYSCGMAWKTDTPNTLVPQFVQTVVMNDTLPLVAR
jgi:DNA-binding transcriptional LysR family regulator